ncbi:hypothetical protein G6F56_010141 [Rhizopus delemar]|nr:hypothetical protein G6F56_010141 [Rhizopus delemar]
MRQKFDVNAVMVMGNWSASNTKFHEPIRGLGFRRLLKKLDSNLRTFKTVPNPRSFRRQRSLTVTCHGLLRSLRTEGDIPDRFNRDAPRTGTGTRRRRQQQPAERRVRPRQQ